MSNRPLPRWEVVFDVVSKGGTYMRLNTCSLVVHGKTEAEVRAKFQSEVDYLRNWAQIEATKTQKNLPVRPAISLQKWGPGQRYVIRSIKRVQGS